MKEKDITQPRIDEPIVIDGIKVKVSIRNLDDSFYNPYDLDSDSINFFHHTRCIPSGTSIHLGKKYRNNHYLLTTNGAMLLRAKLKESDHSVDLNRINILDSEEIDFYQKRFPEKDLCATQLRIFVDQFKELSFDFQNQVTVRHKIPSLNPLSFKLSSFEVTRDYRIMPEDKELALLSIKKAVSMLFGPPIETRKWTRHAVKEGLLFEWHLVNGTRARRDEKIKLRLYEKTSTALRLEIKFENPEKGCHLTNDLVGVEKLMKDLLDKGSHILNQIHLEANIIPMGIPRQKVIQELEKVFKEPMLKRWFEYFVNEITNDGCFDLSKAPSAYRPKLRYALGKIMGAEGSWLEKKPKLKIDGGSSRKFFYALAPEIYAA